jgi:pyridoxal phosphate enzyme (YggS family)
VTADAGAIAENIRRVRDRIAEAAVRSNRRPEDVTLVAAAKMNPAGNVAEAIRAGVDAVGENRVQELLEKHRQGAYAGCPLHFIGRLQSNKVRQVVGLCDLIESVDSEALALEIGRRAQIRGVVQNILIEVNIGREAGKSGVFRENLPGLLEYASNVPGICIRGLMAVPPAREIANKNTNYFDEMYNLFVDIRAKKYDNISMHFLSMGMSDSFVEAICAGANVVRIGSAIFGQRQY